MNKSEAKQVLEDFLKLMREEFAGLSPREKALRKVEMKLAHMAHLATKAAEDKYPGFGEKMLALEEERVKLERGCDGTAS